MSEAAARPRELTMWLAVRMDLIAGGLMSLPKALVQAMHAAQWHAVAETIAGNIVFAEYMDTKTTKKAVVKLKDLAHLEKVYHAATTAGLWPIKVTDLGRTEFDGETTTCVLFGPGYYDDLPRALRLQILKIDKPEPSEETV
jgi:peptidyl-tRNA hydrolase